MPESVLLLPLIVSVAFLSIWAGYRCYRHFEHRRYRAIHREERLRRASFEAGNLDHGRPILDGDEILRRARWDADWGQLMTPVEIKNREESRWPASAAFQVATSIFSGLVIAALIWGGKANLGGNNQGSISTGRQIGEVNGGSPQQITVAPPATDPTFSYLVISVLALFGSGVVLFLRSTSPGGKLWGAGMLTAAAVLPGAKFALIDKFAPEFKPDITINWTHEQHDAPIAPTPFSFTLMLPPFASGSAEPDKDLRCVLHTLARDLAGDKDLSSIIVVGDADKRELKPDVRRKYASNWGLAQQRGYCVQQVLLKAQVAPNKILVTTAGPIHTAGPTSDDLLAKDRRVELFVYGTGDHHPWSNGLTQGVALNRCDENALVADDPCDHNP